MLYIEAVDLLVALAVISDKCQGRKTYAIAARTPYFPLAAALRISIVRFDCPEIAIFVNRAVAGDKKRT